MIFQNNKHTELFDFFDVHLPDGLSMMIIMTEIKIKYDLKYNPLQCKIIHVSNLRAKYCENGISFIFYTDTNKKSFKRILLNMSPCLMDVLI